MVAKSLEFSFDLINGTFAPKEMAKAAISSSSVETITSSKQPAFNAASIEYLIIGLPKKFLIFFRGILLLPPRAVIIARHFFIKKILIYI